MKVSGTHDLAVPRERVFDALQDPAVLARTLPGCQQLEVSGEDTYTATLHAGVASVKGTYTGSVTLLEKSAPDSYRMRAEGAGGPGTIAADAVIRLEENGDGTTVHYDADAIVGGMIGGVGQRMLVGVARKTAGEFFTNVERELTGAAPVPVAAGAPEAGPAETPAGPPSVGTVYAGAPPAPAADTQKLELLIAALVGAAVALLGVLVGRRSAR